MDLDLQSASNYGGFIIGVIGIVLSIYLYQKNLEKKEPKCYYRTYRDIQKISSEGHSSMIKLFYKTEEVERVYTTYVWFWNKGKRPISRSDIPKSDNLILCLSDEKEPARILDFQVLKVTRNSIDFSVSKRDDFSLTIGFEYLDHNDGTVIEIQHTGSYSTKVEIKGVILGTPEGVKTLTLEDDSFSSISTPSQRAYRSERARRFTQISVKQKLQMTAVYIGIIAFIGFVGFGAKYLGDMFPVSPKTEEIVKNVALIFFGLLFVVAPFGMIWFGDRYPFPSSLYFDTTQQKQTKDE